MPSSEVMGKFKRGDLHSGSKTGKKVTNRKQAIAIMLSEKRAEDKNGGTYPDHSTRRKRAMVHTLPGKVTEVGETHDGKYARVRITHGKRRRSKDSKGNPIGGLEGYHRHDTTLIMHKKHAANYPIGARIGGGSDTDMDDDGDEGEEQPAPAPKKKLALVGGKQSSKKAPPKKPGRGAVFAAMTAGAR